MQAKAKNKSSAASNIERRKRKYMNDTNTITTIARIIFDGKDAAAFLQGQLSADVAGLANGKQTRAAYCNRQGRVVASMILYRTFEEQFVAVVCADVADELMMRLSRFILRAKVVMRIEDGGGLTDNANSNNWQRAEIVRGIPWIGKATMEMFLPQFINLDLLGGVSFRKGCYVGQEVIARLHYLGAVKRRAMIIRGSGKTPPLMVQIDNNSAINARMCLPRCFCFLPWLAPAGRFITIPQASRIVLSILVFGGFVFAISRYALRFGGRAIVAMHWPQKQDAVMLHFADGAEMPAVITSTYCASWFVAINAKAGKHNYFIAAALE